MNQHERETVFFIDRSFHFWFHDNIIWPHLFLASEMTAQATPTGSEKWLWQGS